MAHRLEPIALLDAFSVSGYLPLSVGFDKRKDMAFHTSGIDKEMTRARISSAKAGLFGSAFILSAVLISPASSVLFSEAFAEATPPALKSMPTGGGSKGAPSVEIKAIPPKSNRVQEPVVQAGAPSLSESKPGKMTPPLEGSPDSSEQSENASVPSERMQKGKRGREKEADGTQAPNRFEEDTVVKSKYNLDGQPLEVDPD